MTEWVAIDRFAPTALIALVTVAVLLLGWLRADSAAHAVSAPTSSITHGADAVDRAASACRAQATRSDSGAFDMFSTKQLCRMLRLSYQPRPKHTTSRGGDALTAWDLLRIREGLLDEIERRDPDGFTRWLDTTPDVGGDPADYLGSDR